jgi:hypothetical protein
MMMILPGHGGVVYHTESFSESAEGSLAGGSTVRLGKCYIIPLATRMLVAVVSPMLPLARSVNGVDSGGVIPAEGPGGSVC